MEDIKHFRKLDETLIFLLGHVFEEAYIFDKITKQKFGIFDFDNDPTCGLIGQNNDWCLVGGDVLVLKTLYDNTIRLIGDLKHIHELKRINAYKTQILIDPWSEYSSIWQLEVSPNIHNNPISLLKLRDFEEYKDKPFTEKVEW